MRALLRFVEIICILPAVLLAHKPLAQMPAGSYRFINYGPKDGLNEKIIYSATQDRQGYMWFGTGTGLYRYDGHSFRAFRSPIDRPGRTIGNILQTVFTDQSGNLWLGSYTTLQWYRPADKRWWQPDTTSAVNDKLMRSHIVHVTEGKYIWLSTNRNYVYRFRAGDSSFLSLADRYPRGSTPASITTVEAGPFLYDIHAEGVYQFTLEGVFVASFPFSSGDISNAWYDAQARTVYLTTYSSGLQQFSLSDHTYTPVYPQEPALRRHNLLSVYRDHAGIFYMGGYPLHLLHTDRLHYKYLGGDEHTDFEYGIKANKIVNIFPDREGNLWLCGHSGLSMMPWQNSQIRTRQVADRSTGEILEPVGAYHVPGSRWCYLATTNGSGLTAIDLRSGELKTFRNPLSRGRSISGVIAAPDGTIFGSDDHHFFRLNEARSSLEPFALTDQHGKNVTGIARNITDRKGRLFIGATHSGFYRWDYPSAKVIHFHKKDIADISFADTTGILLPTLADHNNHIWFTTPDALYEYRQDDNRFIRHAPSDDAGVPMLNSVSYIEEDLRNHYWIATTSNGLYELYFENGKAVWRNFTTQSGIGLPSDYCVKIRRHPADSLLWISTASGLVRFDPAQRKVLSVLTEENGLGSHGHGYGFGLFQDKILVQLFYGRVSIIDLNSYRFNQQAPVMEINSLRVMGEDRPISADSSGEVLTLRHHSNFLQIEYAAPYFNNGSALQYAYRLDGADRDWQMAGRQNVVSYSDLRPGSYTFRVKAMNNDGVWGQERHIRLLIQPPFYARLWFIIAALSTIGALIYSWQRRRISQVRTEERQQAAMKRQIDALELKALRAQMNPHFIFNSLNGIQRYIFANDPYKASQYLTKFSRLIRLILDQSNESLISLASELEMLKLYLEMESLRFEDKFAYSIEVTEDLSVETCMIPGMLIQPYVENAVWHGLMNKSGKGRLQLRFERKDGESIYVTIQDDGIGRKRAAELRSKHAVKSKSYGMKITNDRMEILKRAGFGNASVAVEDLTDKYGNACGTRVSLLIPVTSITQDSHDSGHSD